MVIWPVELQNNKCRIIGTKHINKAWIIAQNQATKTWQLAKRFVVKNQYAAVLDESEIHAVRDHTIKQSDSMAKQQGGIDGIDQRSLEIVYFLLQHLKCM